jgi:hypothetical protein
MRVYNNNFSNPKKQTKPHFQPKPQSPKVVQQQQRQQQQRNKKTNVNRYRSD